MGILTVSQSGKWCLAARSIISAASTEDNEPLKESMAITNFISVAPKRFSNFIKNKRNCLFILNKT
jgi:hypothetical protein